MTVEAEPNNVVTAWIQYETRNFEIAQRFLLDSRTGVSIDEAMKMTIAAAQIGAVISLLKDIKAG